MNLQAKPTSELQADYEAARAAVNEAKARLAAIKDELTQRNAEEAALKNMTPEQVDRMVSRRVGNGSLSAGSTKAAGN